MLGSRRRGAKQTTEKDPPAFHHELDEKPTILWMVTGGSWEVDGHEPPICKPQTDLVHHEFRFIPIPT